MSRKSVFYAHMRIEKPVRQYYYNCMKTGGLYGKAVIENIH